MITKEELRSLVEQSLSDQKEFQLLTHLKGCITCQRRVEEIFNSAPLYSSLSESEIILLKTQIKLLVQKNNQSALISWQIITNFILTVQSPALAAANDQTSDQKLTNAALSTKTLYFEAICRKSDTGYWRAEMTFPSAPTPETMLTIRFMDAQGKLITNGMLNFCNIEKPVVNGRCFLTIAELRANIRNQTISFRKEEQPYTQGILELFPEEKEGF